MAAFAALDPRIQADVEAATRLVFRDGTLAIAGQHTGAGHPAYVYQFDYTPAPDPARLGAAHCAELPFFFGTLDAYPASPMLGQPTPAARALGREFSHAVAAFAATGQPAGQWHRYDPADSATIRHFA